MRSIHYCKNTIASDLEERSPRALGPLDELVGYHMRRAYGVMSADFAQTFVGTAMRQALFGLLSVISANPGINQGQAGQALGIQRANMVALVNQLVELGLVMRSQDSTDRRVSSLTLTDRGTQMLQSTLSQIRQHEERMLQHLTSRERSTLIALLRKTYDEGC